ncbi:hypothetical protein VTL71DRAFT_1572 [Oculimacula yallundae]|uniref:Uncharacterized protein n=1 Tax=Oculimacula yallundae TaxID=86028 RepID=A0ABR4CDH0_9HELO
MPCCHAPKSHVEAQRTFPSSYLLAVYSRMHTYNELSRLERHHLQYSILLSKRLGYPPHLGTVSIPLLKTPPSLQAPEQITHDLHRIPSSSECIRHHEPTKCHPLTTCLPASIAEPSILSGLKADSDKHMHFIGA